MSTPRKPRKRPAPSSRDQEIYLAYQTSGKTQAQLAEKYELDQTRISQIVRKVAAWRSQADPRDEGELTTRQQKRLDRWLEHERLDTIVRQSLQSFHQEQRTITNKKSGHRGDNSFSEESTRELPANVQYLKTALRAQEQLSQLEDKPYLPAEEPDERQRHNIMYSELCRLRQEAERTGKVSKSTDAWGVVKRWLDALQGEANDSQRTDPAMQELAQLIIPVSAREGDPGEGDPWEGEAPAEPSTPRTPLSTPNDHDSDSSQPSAANELAPSVAQEKTSPVAPSPYSPLSTPYSVPSTPPTWNLEPGTLNSAAPPRPRSPHVKPETSNVKPPRPLSPAARRLAYEQKLEQYRAAVRSGLPYMMEWDPEDGPIPPAYYHLDGVGAP